VSLARRRALWRSGAIGVGVVLAAVVAVVPLPFLELSPGPTYNVIGEVDGQPLLKVSGATTYPTDGQLDMTTVSERGGPDNGVLSLRLLTGWLDPAVRVLPREAFYPEDITDEDVSQENARLFSDSTATAVAAAAGYLDEPVTEITIVSSVITGSPADGKLEPGDQILTVDGDAISTPDDVARAMDDVRPGQTVAVEVDRGGTKLVQQIVTIANPDKPERAFMGITIGTTYEAEFDVDVTLSTVGGPSAGLFFSLGIVDLLTPGAMTEGRHIAGTGTIDPAGSVGPIGGITQKLNGARDSGATLFLVPADNCAEALAGGVPPGLELARVTTLDDAVAAVEAYAAGKPVVGCAAG
jgi:PDZ domain-containing protein